MVYLFVDSERDVTWRGIAPAILERFSKAGKQIQSLDVSEFSYLISKEIPDWLLPSLPQEFRDFLLESEPNINESILIKRERGRFWSKSLITSAQLDEVQKSIHKLGMSVFNDIRPERHFLLFPLLFFSQLNACLQLFIKAKSLISTMEEVEALIIPNGRLPHQRTMLLVAQELSIPIYFYERGFNSGPNYQFSQLSPHDRVAWQAQASLKNYDNPREVRAQTKIWLSSREALDSETNEYSRGWDHSAGHSGDSSLIQNPYSAVFFTSSEEEFVSMEGWEGYGWRDQYEAFESFSRNIRGPVAIRIHPNFLNKALGHGLEEVLRIFWLKRKIGTLEIVWPHESRNSYELMRSANRIVVFGSTIGLEASASGRCVWIAGNSIYDLGADVRVFKKANNYPETYFLPWTVNPERALRIADYFLFSDSKLTASSFEWNKSNVPLFVRIAKFSSNGMNTYFFILAQYLVSRTILGTIVRVLSFLEKLGSKTP